MQSLGLQKDDVGEGLEGVLTGSRGDQSCAAIL